ncbi:lysophospholipid acyltransferase family protein [Candidatus Pelagibacter sp.]|nr:lysophospholipid acyltransferase family protein [Candidatus Pelagibacter sp.]MDC0856189.1 lysophospholipid acyltransferase family protein [Candidatus Pelagibacter sp.]
MLQKIRYFFEFLIITFLFSIFKVLGIKISSYIGGKIGNIIGPLFRSKKLIKSNIANAMPNISENEVEKIIKKMWNNYGRILSEYIFIKKFRNTNLEENLLVEGSEVLEAIKQDQKPVIFISGHFDNFELMAMHIEKSGIKLSAIYRPLNNFFINKIMEKIRKNYICKNQIKKGAAGIRELLTMFKNGNSIALMIDQRVSEGIESNFFGQKALTTTIPAQFVKRFNCRVVPIYIERISGIKFKIKINSPIEFSQEKSIENITDELNSYLEKMILQKPDQWIWTHNRWK